MDIKGGRKITEHYSNITKGCCESLWLRIEKDVLRNKKKFAREVSLYGLHYLSSSNGD